MSTSELEITNSLSANAQAILLLTAPLLVGGGDTSKELLSASEYGKLARALLEQQRQPADLLSVEGSELFVELRRVVNSDRLQRLIARGFLLSQAIERWQTRSIWVVSRADEGYPARLKERLKEMAPPILYGCGDSSILDGGGLAVVGSRHADAAILESAARVGELAARSQRSIISGGARGIDQAAMSGALDAGGNAVGVLADSLERAALNRDHRNYLRDGQLVLISPYDPQAGFNVGNAMQRNKVVYALSDAALVVQSDYGKGGTWAGATEQVDKLRLVPVYTLPTAQPDAAFESLAKKGALTWPDPTTAEEFWEVLAVGVTRMDSQDAPQLSFSPDNGDQSVKDSITEVLAQTPAAESDEDQPRDASTEVASPDTPPDEQLFALVRALFTRFEAPKTEKEIGEELKVTTPQVKEWLKRLISEGALEKLSRPTRYRATKNSKLF